MSESSDEPEPSTKPSKPEYRKRPMISRKKYEAIFPARRLTEPYYGDTTCPHSALCGLNRPPPRSINTDNALKPALFRSTYPAPIFEGSLANPKIDLCLELAKVKKLFIRNVQSIKQCYQKNKSKINEELKQIPQTNADTMMVKKFAETLETDPDKYFNGTYDWYFTGGSMDIVNFDGNDFLVHSEGDKLQNLKISQLTSDADIVTTNVFDATAQSLHTNGTIYEIKSMVDEPIFTVRQKRQLTIGNLCTLGLEEVKTDTPLVSSDIERSMKLVTVDAQQHLQLFNVLDMKQISDTKIFTDEITIDNWTHVRFVNPNQFICTSRKVVSVYDVRQRLEPVIHQDLTNWMGPCEDLTCLEQSKYSNRTYLATTHKLHALDIRNANEKMEPTLTWVHQLKTSPIFMDICKKDDSSELIALGGIKSGDVKLFVATECQNELISTHLPYTPVSVHDAFKYARSVGKFLDPNSLVERQLRQSNTGVKLRATDSNRFSLLIKNTSGDIFQQDVERKDGSVCTENQEPRISKMVDWDRELRRRRENVNKLGVSVTSLTNFRSMVAYLRSNLHKECEPTKPKPSAERQPWQMSIEELASYQDVLANSLLDKWVIAEDVEMNEPFEDSRMTDWVESTVQQFNIFEEDICVKGEPEIQEYS